MLHRSDFLEDVVRREQRFRIEKMLFEAGEYQIALASDVLMDDKLVCVKTIAYDTARVDNKKYVGMRRKALHEELGFLSLPVHLLPEPLDWIQLEHSETALPREPLLVYEYVHGETLYDLVQKRHPDGIAPTRALRIMRELCRFLGQIHQHKWVFRNLDPRHVIISYDDIIHIVGCGNATPMGQPPNPTRASMESPYAAPEIRGEVSGKLLRPSADIYSLGALLSFMLTGEEPRASVENPLTQRAFESLSACELPGLALLVARCIQPMAKNRFGRAEKLLPFTEPSRLPRPTDEGFGLLQLPAPWTGAESPDNRATRSKLSAGPLLSEPGGQTQLEKAAPTAVEPAKEQGRDWFTIAAVAFLLAAMAFALLAFLIL